MVPVPILGYGSFLCIITAKHINCFLNIEGAPRKVFNYPHYLPRSIGCSPGIPHDVISVKLYIISFISSNYGCFVVCKDGGGDGLVLLYSF